MHSIISRLLTSPVQESASFSHTRMMPSQIHKKLESESYKIGAEAIFLFMTRLKNYEFASKMSSSQFSLTLLLLIWQSASYLCMSICFIFQKHTHAWNAKKFNVFTRTPICIDKKTPTLDDITSSWVYCAHFSSPRHKFHVEFLSRMRYSSKLIEVVN